MRARSAQIPFVANDELDVIVDEIDTVRQLHQVRVLTRKMRIDFDDDWAVLRPPKFNVRWPPAEVESSHTGSGNISDTLILMIG